MTYRLEIEKLTTKDFETAVIYKGDTYYGVAGSEEKGREMVAAMNAGAASTIDPELQEAIKFNKYHKRTMNNSVFGTDIDPSKHDIADTMGEGTVIKCITDDFSKVDTRLDALEAAHLNASTIMETLGSLCRSQQKEIDTYHTRLNSQRNRTDRLSARLELLEGRIQSREETEAV